MKQAVTGFYQLASADPFLIDYLGAKSSGRARLYRGWPSDTLTQTDYPRATYRKTADRVRRPGFYDVVIQVDVWVWPSGEASGDEQLSLIDQRFVELLDEAHWIHDSTRLYGLALSGSDAPSGRLKAIRHTRDFRISASPG